MEDALVEGRIALALDKALRSRPEILDYLRHIIIDDVINNLKTLTDTEVSEFIANVKAKES